MDKQIGIGEVMEVILYVEDMNRQVTFYRDVLGLKVMHTPALEDYANEFWVQFDTGFCSLALHGGGQRRFGDDAPKFVFRVNDIHEVRQLLVDQQVEMGDIRSAAPGVWVCDGVDPEGNKFSIESQE